MSEKDWGEYYYQATHVQKSPTRNPFMSLICIANDVRPPSSVGKAHFINQVLSRNDVLKRCAAFVNEQELKNVVLSSSFINVSEYILDVETCD